MVAKNKANLSSRTFYMASSGWTPNKRLLAVPNFQVETKRAAEATGKERPNQVGVVDDCKIPLGL
jgi:hypothetical protein